MIYVIWYMLYIMSRLKTTTLLVLNQKLPSPSLVLMLHLRVCTRTYAYVRECVRAFVRVRVRARE